MKKLATTSNNEPEPPIMAVAVNTLTPDVQLYCHQPIGGFPAGTILTVYGGNLKYPSAYVEGFTPPEWRVAVEDGDFGSEVIYKPLPSLMQEIIFDEHPGQFEILLPDARVIQLHRPEPEEAPMCKVIKHPASYAPQRIEKPASKKKPNGRQLFLFPETDLQPQKETA